MHVRSAIMRILLLIVAVLLILLSLLQGGKSEGLSAFTGSGDLGLFQNVKERGPEKIISRATLVLGVLFFALVIVIRIVE
ncbi:MAG: preprotein translocase subunit SecG [Erysipelotrichaceae bacterium]|nr:preprotein translocase subunit SecG [Erysipelotrichaceae bacterium]